MKIECPYCLSVNIKSKGIIDERYTGYTCLDCKKFHMRFSNTNVVIQNPKNVSKKNWSDIKKIVEYCNLRGQGYDRRIIDMWIKQIDAYQFSEEKNRNDN